MSGVSFLPEEHVALITAIEGDATLAGLLAGDKVHSGLAPEETPFNYITLGNMTEVERSLFMKQGTLVTMTMSIWTKGQGELPLLNIWKALKALLHNERLPLTEGVVMSGKLSLTLVGLGSPNDSSILRGIVTYDVRATEA